MASPKKIMVIDDSPVLRSQVHKLLAIEGYEVLEAADGLQGALAIREQGPRLSLVICDLNMPKMDGLAMLEVLRGQFPNLPILMLTTDMRKDKMESAKLVGAKGWMVKPFRPELLVSAVKRLTKS